MSRSEQYNYMDECFDKLQYNFTWTNACTFYPSLSIAGYSSINFFSCCGRMRWILLEL